MARYLPASHFFILSFAMVAVLCSTLCVAGDGAGGSSGGESGKVSAKLFEPKKKMESVQVFSAGADQSSSKAITLCKIKLPFLLFAAKDNVMVAVTEAEYTDQDGGVCEGGDGNVGVVAKFIETKENINWKSGNIEATIKTWTSQLVTNNGQTNKFSTVMASAVNAEKKKIYVFLLDSTVNSGEWKVNLLSGTISDAGGSKKFDWGTKEMPKPKLVEEVKQKLSGKSTGKSLTLSLVDGSAFLLKSGKILLVVKGTSKEGSTTEDFTAVFRLNEEETELELLFAEKAADRRSIFEWKGELYRTLTTDPSDGSKKVMVFDESENDFTDRDSSITRLGDFLKDKKNFATSKIVVKGSTLLFTEERENKSGGEGKNDAHLWMSDGDRVGYVGPIITGFKKISYGPVLRINNNLFVLHQNYNTGNGDKKDNEFNITLLDGELDKIKDIITTWENNDKKIEGLCKDAFTTVPPCLTDGPVGFLSGNKSGEEWKNEYLNVNAKLSNEKSGVVRKNVQNGFKFSGEGAGAQWPVVEPGQDQPYNFINPGFTLVATVAIGSETKGADNSVLGVGFKGNTNKVGLWCSTDGKWEVRNGQTRAQSPEINCAPDEKHYVALILNGSEKVSVYVNGQQLTELNSDKIKIDSSTNIDYFYFGADKNTRPETSTDVTIENVLLYNRPFTTDEVKQLKPIKNTEANNQQNQNTAIDPQNPEESTTRNDSPQPKTSATKKDEEEDKQSSPPPTTEDSAARVSVVGVLCFMLFGVFTLLGRYVY